MRSLWGGDDAQIFLYGDSGVGKTNLINHAIAQASVTGATVNVKSGASLEDVIRDCLLRFGHRYVEQSKTQTSSIGRTAEWALPKFLEYIGHIGVSGETSSSETVTLSLIREDGQDLLAQAMVANKIDLLVIDNAQNLKSQDDLEKVGAMMEYFSGLKVQNPDWKMWPRLAAAGISSNADGIIQGSQSIRRRVKQIGVPRMSPSKIKDLLSAGFRELSLTWDQESLEQLSFYADGYPFFAHKLGRECSLVSNVYETGFVDIDTVEEAAGAVAQDESASMQNMIVKARGTRDTAKKIRSKVLDVIASKNWDTWTVRNVIDSWTEVHGGEPASEKHVGTELKNLSSEEGEIKILGRKMEYGTYIYSFDDPHTRPYLRMEMKTRSLS